MGASWCSLARLCLSLPHPAIPPRGTFSGGGFRISPQGAGHLWIRRREAALGLGGCPPLGLGGRLSRRSRGQMCTKPVPLKPATRSEECKEQSEEENAVPLQKCGIDTKPHILQGHSNKVHGTHTRMVAYRADRERGRKGGKKSIPTPAPTQVSCSEYTCFQMSE